MYFKSQPLLAVVTIFALAIQAEDLNPPQIYNRTCLTNKEFKDIEVPTNKCQKAIDKLMSKEGFINPARTGCVELASAGRCSITICANEAIPAKVVAIAAERIHGECKPIGKGKKHVVAGSMQRVLRARMAAPVALPKS
jgi:hypothetical protein